MPRTNQMLAQIAGVAAVVAAAVCSPSDARAVTIGFSWSGAAGYSASGSFSYDAATAPTLVTGSGLGAQQVIQSFSVTFLDPSRNVLESGSAVVGGVSSDRFFRVDYNTAANTISALDADVGGASYQYFLTNLRTPTGQVVPSGVTGFNFFNRATANAALDTAASISVTVQAVPEPSTLGCVLAAGFALAAIRRRAA